MRRFWAVVLTLVLVAPVLAGQDGPSAEEKARLDKGEVLVEARPGTGSRPPVTRMRGVIDAPPAAVWKHIEDCAKYAEFMPRVAESRLVKRDGNRVDCYVKVDMPFPLPDYWSETKALHEELPDGSFRRRWKLLKGTYERNTGAWVLSPWGEKGAQTLVTYTISVIPDGNVPEAFRREAQKKGLPDLMDALRKRVLQ